MRTIQAAAITEAVARLCIQANTYLPADIVAALDRQRKAEPWPCLLYTSPSPRD